MDDDQFQGNLNVQGGNPEQEEPTEEAPAEEAQAAAGPESEMSRRMSEILGSFDDGVATADAIASGNGKVVQGTAIRADAPRPDFAQQPTLEPVQADVTVATEGAYDTTGAEVPAAAPAAEPQVYDAGPATLGATPEFTGTPRSSIEQAAAEEAAREAVAQAERKRIDPKIIIGIVVAVVAIAAAVVIIAINMSGKKDDKKEDGDTSQMVEEEPEEEPVVEMQRIGTETHGYVSVPKDWSRSLDENVTAGGGFGYSDAKKKNIVIINSAAIGGTMTAQSFANGQLNSAKAANMSQPQMVTEKHGSYDMYKVFYYDTKEKTWSFKYVFEAEDNRVHYIQVITDVNTSDLISSVPDSWSVNQNSEGSSKKTEGESEGEPEIKTEKPAEDAAETEDSPATDESPKEDDLGRFVEKERELGK